MAGPPTQEQAYQFLLQQELENIEVSESSANKFAGKTHFINDGLRLERDQCV